MLTIRNQSNQTARILGAICLTSFFSFACNQKRGAAPAKSSCKAGEIKDSTSGKCEGATDASGGKESSSGADETARRGSTDTSGAGVGSGAQGGGDSVDPKGDRLSTPKPGEDSNNDAIPDVGKDTDGDGQVDTPPLRTGPGSDLSESAAAVLERQQEQGRYTQFPQGFAPTDGWDISGGMAAPGFSSTFSTANSSFGSVKLPVRMWIGRDHQNSRGAVVAFAQFQDPKAAANVKFLYRRKAYDQASVMVDSYGRFAGSLAIDVQMMFDYQTQGGAMKCKTPVAQLDGRYLAVDPQSMAPREVFNAEAACGKQ